MSERDLSKAVEAASVGLWNHRPMQRTTDGKPLPFEDAKPYEQRRHREMGQAAIAAALPHILDALVEQAVDDYLSSPGHTITKTAFQAAHAARWLRAKAEEALA